MFTKNHSHTRRINVIHSDSPVPLTMFSVLFSGSSDFRADARTDPFNHLYPHLLIQTPASASLTCPAHSTDDVGGVLSESSDIKNDAGTVTSIPHPLSHTLAPAYLSQPHSTDDVGGGLLGESCYIRNDAGTIIHISHPLTHRHQHLIPIVLMMLEVVLVRIPISKMMLAQLSTSHINSIAHRHQHHFDG